MPQSLFSQMMQKLHNLSNQPEDDSARFVLEIMQRLGLCNPIERVALNAHHSITGFEYQLGELIGVADGFVLFDPVMRAAPVPSAFMGLISRYEHEDRIYYDLNSFRDRYAELKIGDLPQRHTQLDREGPVASCEWGAGHTSGGLRLFFTSEQWAPIQQFLDRWLPA